MTAMHATWNFQATCLDEKFVMRKCKLYENCSEGNSDTSEQSQGVHTTLGRVIAQVVSRRLHTEAARIRGRVGTCGICGRQSDTGAGFSRVLRFSLPIVIPPTASYSSFIIRGWYNRPTVADVPSGLNLTTPQETKKKKLNYIQL
jgi:hypothetical protein